MIALRDRVSSATLRLPLCQPMLVTPRNAQGLEKSLRRRASMTLDRPESGSGGVLAAACRRRQRAPGGWGRRLEDGDEGRSCKNFRREARLRGARERGLREKQSPLGGNGGNGGRGERGAARCSRALQSRGRPSSSPQRLSRCRCRAAIASQSRAVASVGLGGRCVSCSVLVSETLVASSFAPRLSTAARSPVTDLGLPEIY